MEENITILMSNYNNSEFVEAAIESILEQTSGNWELLICDDCSKDDSVNRIGRYSSDPRIRLLRNDVNRGTIFTLKRMIAEASNDIVGIVDSDDRLRKDAVQKVLEAYKENPGCGFVYSNFMYCDEKLNPIREGFGRLDEKPAVNDKIGHLKTFRRTVYLTTPGLDDSLLHAEDKDLCLKMEEVTDLVFVDKILYDYRVLHGSQSHNPIRAQIALTSFVRALCMSYSRRNSSGKKKITEKDLLERITTIRKNGERLLEKNEMSKWLSGFPMVQKTLQFLMNIGMSRNVRQKLLFRKTIPKTYFIACHKHKTKIFLYDGAKKADIKHVREAVALNDYSVSRHCELIFSRTFDWWSILPVEDERYNGYQRFAIESATLPTALARNPHVNIDRIIPIGELMAILEA